MNLYRGMSTQEHPGVRQNSYLHTPRRPLNSCPNVHAIADDWFNSKFGIRARSETIFCSTDIDQARQYQNDYGSLMKVLPVGSNYSLIYSQLVHDFLEIEAEISDTNNDRQIIDWLEGKQYQLINELENLPDDLDGEVMLYCSEYELRNL